VLPVNGKLEPVPPRRPVDQPLHRHPRSRSCTGTGRTTTPNRSGIRQEGRQLRSTVRHTSTHIEIVRHACKLLPPWPIKGGAAPSHGGTGRRIAITHTLSAFSTILALASINTSGTWRPRLLSRLACSHPSTSTSVQAIQCPEHTTAGRTTPAETRINQVSLVACHRPSRGRSRRSLLVSVGTTSRIDKSIILSLVAMLTPGKSLIQQQGSTYMH
jgi:hypothetical protein